MLNNKNMAKEFSDRVNAQMNKPNYTRLIDEEIKLINKHVPEGLSKSHIILVLQNSIDNYYPGGNQND